MAATRTAVLLVLGLALLGCTPSRVLLVDLRTDYAPGLEFTGVRTELLPPSRVSFQTFRLAAVAGLGQQFSNSPGK